MIKHAARHYDLELIIQTNRLDRNGFPSALTTQRTRSQHDQRVLHGPLAVTYDMLQIHPKATGHWAADLPEVKKEGED